MATISPSDSSLSDLPSSSPFNFADGAMLLVDKPLEWTSFDVVKKMRGLTRVKKIGHAGTLDPLATGLLVLCTGKMTKQIERFQGMEKAYEGALVLGKTTPSIDLETDFDSEQPTDHIKIEQLETVRQKFVGLISQIPPQYSAIKVDGRRVYKSARQGKKVEIKPREVQITTFDFTEITLPEVRFSVVCSKGTYIRSLVRDIGQELGVGAYLKELRRTRIGHLHVNDARTIADWTSTLKPTEE
ncbi:tRNA pseudouridine(55) synthase TruB [Tunicatimonas pelagia]|uniref:tRNA pseudouridine(55) synthase TruB n=1 Tax=Tunicatimonas pelagia TaxID=931531 RepID=UPI00266533E2|nr:tRNA pseudouridine(55) synthase TruB [Tunicatimonas pelagia]WKN43613.1 tRNA pseudouridine(55) synthase TruB [Tunicatimonas pelagia]